MSTDNMNSLYSYKVSGKKKYPQNQFINNLTQAGNNKIQLTTSSIAKFDKNFQPKLFLNSFQLNDQKLSKNCD